MSTSITPRPARETVISLLTAAGLPHEDLTESHLEHFFCAGEASAPVGIVGLELHGDCALLRSLAVSESVRATGIGSALVSHAEAYARSRGARAIYLLTTTAEDFFTRLGYARADRSAAPAAIQSTREFTDLCPASSAFMVKQL
jgi:amino-acid N-acetyltransferase